MPLPEPNLAVVPEDTSHPGMSVAQYLAIARSYRKQILFVTISLVILSFVFIKMLAKTYTAATTLIVNTDLKDPLAGRDFPAEMINNYIVTQIELMTSPIVLLPVVDRLKLTEDKEFTAGFGGSSGEALREFVQRNLASKIQAEKGIGGQLLYVSASAREPDKAAALANAVADVYLEQDQRRLTEPASERAQRYTEELAELREKATVAQDKVTEFRRQNGIGDLNSASAGTEEQSLDNLNQRLIETQNQRRALEAKLSGKQTADEKLGSTTLDAQLAQLAQLSTTYGPQHPKVKELKAQIDLTRQSLASGNQTMLESTQTDLARTIELERKYRQAIAEQQAKVTKVRQARDEGSKLVLELDSAKAVYKQALDGFDRIMFQAVANHTNVSVVTRAVPPLRASKPNKTKLMLGALMASLGIGVGGPLAYGLFLARRLRCRDDMERDFGIAVLAQLDKVPNLVPST